MESPQQPGIGLGPRLAEVPVRLCACFTVCRTGSLGTAPELGLLGADGRTRGGQSWPFHLAEVPAKGEPGLSTSPGLPCDRPLPGPHLAAGIPVVRSARPLRQEFVLCVLHTWAWSPLASQGCRCTERLQATRGAAGGASLQAPKAPASPLSALSRKRADSRCVSSHST